MCELFRAAELIAAQRDSHDRGGGVKATSTEGGEGAGGEEGRRGGGGHEARGRGGQDDGVGDMTLNNMMPPPLERRMTS